MNVDNQYLYFYYLRNQYSCGEIVIFMCYQGKCYDIVEVEIAKYKFLSNIPEKQQTSYSRLVEFLPNQKFCELFDEFKNYISNLEENVEL